MATAMAMLLKWVMPQTADGILLIALPLAALWLVAILVFWFVSASRGVRLQRWASSRGLAYRERMTGADRGSWRGMPFAGGGRFIVRRLLQRGDEMESGRFQSIPDREGNGNGAFRKPFSFVRFELPVAVPHIVVTNRRSSVLSWAGIAVSRGTALGGSLEFDATFTLHCPPEYERDALYIFTPDVLAAMLDYAPGAELELVDDEAYLYFSKEPPLWNEDVADAMLALVTKLRSKLDRQTHRYEDGRVAETSKASVALGGLRLGRGISGHGRLVLALSWVPFAVAVGWFALTEWK
jgi:hypothetical protein